MGNTLATDTIPVLATMVDVHNPKAQDQFYFCNVSSGGASTKVIGRSQTLSVEVGVTTVLSLIVYECPEPVFTPETARCLGVLRIPIERLAERYSSGIFQQWFNLDTRSDPRAPAGDPQQLVSKFEQAYTDAVADVYQPKICLSVIGSAFEVQRGGRQTCAIFVGEDVKTQAGPDLKALIASHKQQAAYIDALHEELRRLNVPSYRPIAGGQSQGPGPRPSMPPPQGARPPMPGPGPSFPPGQTMPPPQSFSPRSRPPGPAPSMGPGMMPPPSMPMGSIPPTSSMRPTMTMPPMSMPPGAPIGSMASMPPTSMPLGTIPPPSGAPMGSRAQVPMTAGPVPSNIAGM